MSAEPPPPRSAQDPAASPLPPYRSGTEPGGANGRDRPERRPTREGYVGVPRSGVGVGELFGGVFWALGVSIVGVVLLSLFDPSVTDPDLEQPDGIKLAVQAFAALGFISAAIGMVMIADRAGLADALRRLGLGAGGRRLLGTFGLAVLIYAILATLVAGLLEPQQEDIAENLGADENAPVLVLVVAGTLIIGAAAIGEELFFRGLLFGGLRQLLPLWPAAVLSGVLFGLPHLPQGDLAVGLQLSIFGVVLAWAYERCGSLWVPIAMHALNNSLAFYFLVTDRI